MAYRSKEVKKSPLYTKPEDKVAKAAIVKRLGRDMDGAYRAYNRIDERV